jgi:hypothetical protein
MDRATARWLKDAENDLREIILNRWMQRKIITKKAPYKGGGKDNCRNTQFGHPWPRSADHERRNQ